MSFIDNQGINQNESARLVDITPPQKNNQQLHSKTPSQISSRLSTPNNEVAIKASIELKKQMYAKKEADELMDEELERRTELTHQRVNAAKKVLAQKTHCLILNEIATNLGGVSQTVARNKESIDNLEDQYRKALWGAQSFSPDEKEQQQSHDIYSQYNTVDTHPKTSFQGNDDNEILEEVVQLNKKPHPQPTFPNSIQQSNEKYHNKSLENSNSKIYHSQQQKTSTKSPSNQKVQNKKPIKTIYESVKSPKVFYRNNFSKDTKFVDKQIKQQKQEVAKYNLQHQLNQLVENYDQEQDDSKVEDMILELNRLNQKTNGLIPTQQQAKIQQFVTEMELQKLTYSKLQQNKSPTNQNSNEKTPIKLRMSSNLRNQEININSGKLKDIINNTESKVKQTIQGQRTGYTTNQPSTRHSFDRSGYQSEQTSSSQKLDHKASIDTLRNKIGIALNDINARVLAKFLKRKTESLYQGDYYVGYLLALLVSLVDESLPLTNDKSDIANKSWEDISRQLSNHGKIVYSLQKLRIAFDKDDFNKLLHKTQFFKKYDDMKNQFKNCHGTASPLISFIEKIAFLLTQYKLIIAKQSEQQKQAKNQNKNINISLRKKNLQHLQSPNQSKQYESPRPIRNVNSVCVSPKHQQRTPKPISIQGQLIQQRQSAIDKNYKLQMEYSKNLREQEESAKKKQIYIAKLRMESKAFQARVDKEDLNQQELEQKIHEDEYLKYQSDFKHRMSSIDKKQVEQQKLKMRELSLENQEFKRKVKNQEKEQELLYYKEESQKSLHDLQWKQKQNLQNSQKKNMGIQQKQQELVLSKVKQNEQYLNSQEQELGERLKQQMERATNRFQQLSEQEDAIRKEISTLRILSQKQK